MSLLKIAHVPAATIEPEATVLDAVNVMAARAVVGSGETVAVKYVVQWKEENGDWKWHVDIEYEPVRRRVKRDRSQAGE